jgi:hypothetical protein
VRNQAQVDVDLDRGIDCVRPRNVDDLGSGVDPFMIRHEEEQLATLPRVVLVMRFLPAEFVRADRLDRVPQELRQIEDFLFVAGGSCR